MSEATGEAVYVDLGKGARPIVAVMVPRVPRRRTLEWGEGTLCCNSMVSLARSQKKTRIGIMRRVARLRGPRRLTADDLPDLVAFADINDPKSVLAIDPHDLPAALGRDVKWNSITVEVTNEPVTTGIERKLPWLKSLQGQLDGSHSRYWDHRASLANSLNVIAFKKTI
jgi:hypothetical protein